MATTSEFFSVTLALLGGFMAGMLLVYLYFLARLKERREALVSVISGLVGLAVAVGGSGAVLGAKFPSLRHLVDKDFIVFFPIGLGIGVITLTVLRVVVSRYRTSPRLRREAARKEEWYDVPLVEDRDRKSAAKRF